MASEIDEIRARLGRAEVARRNEVFGMDDARTLLAGEESKS